MTSRRGKAPAGDAAAEAAPAGKPAARSRAKPAAAKEPEPAAKPPGTGAKAAAKEPDKPPVKAADKAPAARSRAKAPAEPAAEPPPPPASPKDDTAAPPPLPDAEPDDASPVGDALTYARSRLADLGIDLEQFGPRNVTDIVGRAASVLEEELAAGIVAARRVEERFVDVERIRERHPDELVSRLRRDVHDLVDILIDLLDAAASTALGATRRVVSLQAAAPAPAAAPAAAGLSVLEVPGPAAPGTSATIAMLVDNESDEETAPFALVSSDLVGVDNSIIPGDRVRLDPAEVSLAPRERRRIGIEVTIPDGTPAGTYVGVVQASRMEQVRALLTVRVA